MESAHQHRARRHIRAERAFGLGSFLVAETAAPASRPDSDSPAPIRSAPTFVARPDAPPATAPPSAPGVAAIAPKPAAPSEQEPLPGQPLPRQQRLKILADLDRDEVRPCNRCPLAKTRTQTVFGEGDCEAPIFFIGEGPGETEDQTGRPFVGKAGQLLDKMILAMDLSRERVFIANIVKCRPPGNRVPAPAEVEACTPYLLRQLQVVRPRVIVTLGAPATQYMLQTKTPIGRLRGNWQLWRGIRLMPTFHPSYVLRTYTADVRAMVWSDLQQVMAEIGLPTKSPNQQSGARSNPRHQRL